MSSNSFGENFRITTFGESHGPALGVVIDGIRPGIDINIEDIQRELDRRRPGQSALTTPRKETDQIEILSGVFEGKSTGAPIALLVRNHDSRSRDYEKIKDLFRPGHADFTWQQKFGIRDWRGGGRTSGRETIARVAAGAIAKKILSDIGVRIIGHVIQIGKIRAQHYDESAIEQNPVRCADATAAEQMAAAIITARNDGNSMGGIVEIVASNVPAGWGDPVFNKLDALLAAGMMSIGAVKGVEIGDGFALASQLGSQTNDGITPDGFISNHMGGILGGISNGAPIVVRIAVKPTASIRHEQPTIDTSGQARTIVVPGRHDPCICPRIVPVAEAMMALVLGDAYLRQQAITNDNEHHEAQALAELAYCESELARIASRYHHIRSQCLALNDEQIASALTPQRTDLTRNLNIAPEFIPNAVKSI